jgi:hypothetical protein
MKEIKRFAQARTQRYHLHGYSGSIQKAGGSDGRTKYVVEIEHGTRPSKQSSRVNISSIYLSIELGRRRSSSIKNKNED